jgi:hypothetical protein
MEEQKQVPPKYRYRKASYEGMPHTGASFLYGTDKLFEDGELPDSQVVAMMDQFKLNCIRMYYAKSRIVESSYSSHSSSCRTGSVFTEWSRERWERRSSINYGSKDRRLDNVDNFEPSTKGGRRKEQRRQV